MMMLRPGCSTSWNLPSRSTTHACCCGTTRTPSTTNAITNAMMVTPIANTPMPFHANAATETMSAMISFKSMLVSFEAGCSGTAPSRAPRRPMARTGWRTWSGAGRPPCTLRMSALTMSSGLGGLCGPVAIGERSGLLLRDAQRVALDRADVEHLARLTAELAFDDRVPERVAVPNPREAVAAVHPRIEGHGMAEVERGHGGRRQSVPATADPQDAAERDRGSDERGDAEHQEVEGAGEKLGDDEHDADDQPGKRAVHAVHGAPP